MPQSATRTNRHSKSAKVSPAADNDNYDDREGAGPIFFWREWEEPHGFLCQFYRCSFTDQVGESPITGQASISTEQHAFNCAEQYMMYLKALILATPDAPVQKTSSNKSTHPPPQTIPPERKHLPEAILASDNPNKQKYLVRSIPFTPAQEKLYQRIKLDIVIQGNYYKFTQNPELKAKLLATGHRKLVEAAPNDKVWGIGFLARDARKHTHTGSWGLNLLGVALMSVRETIRSEEEARLAAMSVKVDDEIVKEDLEPAQE